MLLQTEKLLVAVGVLFGVCGIFLFFEESQRGSSLTQVTETRIVPDEPRVFHVPLNEKDAPLNQPEYPIEGSALSSKPIMGGVIPHHLLASDFLVEFFQLITARSNIPKTIVLLAPNHFETGGANIQTVNFLWRTPYGGVETDTALLQNLLQATGAEEIPQSFEAEHGIYNILPYIARFLPTTKVVPVILRYNTTQQEISELVTFLRPLIERGSVMVVGSVDFSHYLSKAESDRKDAETLLAMKSYDLSRIARFQSDHLDSPAAILILLQLAHETGMSDIHVLRHDNSADGTRGSHDSTTGHFSLLFTGSSEEKSE